MDKRNELILKQFESDLYDSSERTRADRLFYARLFLNYAGDRPFGEWSREMVNGFIQQCSRSYAPGTTRKIYGIVKRVFDAAKVVWEMERNRMIIAVNPKQPAAVAELLKAMSMPAPLWDMGKRGAPTVNRADEVKPACTKEKIKLMTQVARQGKLKPDEAAFLAIASIYGLRLGELKQIRPEHINWKQKTLFVLTEKHGEQREQLLCEEVIPFMKECDFDCFRTNWQMSGMYLRIEHTAGIEHKEGGGWHSIRRFLDTELVEACEREYGHIGELYTHFFLRWKMSGSMVQRYYSRSPLEIDERVLAVNPVVPLWK